MTDHHTATSATTSVPTAILMRVGKLLALARDGGATEAEAANALAKAQHLQAEYNLDIATVMAAGRKVDEARSLTQMQDRTVYKWRRELMTQVCRINFCHAEVEWISERYGKAPTFAGFSIVGRECNIAASRVMFDYLIQTIERMAREFAAERGENVFAKPAILFREGCAERLQERLQIQYYDMLREQRARAEEANRNYSGNTLPAVILANYAEDEADYNKDMRLGLEPGTTGRQKREQRARSAALTAYQDEHKCEWSVAWEVVVRGKSHEEALAIFAQEKAGRLAQKANAKPETPAQARKRAAKQARADQRYQDAYRRRDAKEEARKRHPGYVQGRRAAADISLNQQVDKSEVRKLV